MRVRWVRLGVFSHVPGVAEAAVAGLRRALVVAHLQVQLALVRAQLFLGELALVLVGHLGAEPGAGVLGVLLGLRQEYETRVTVKHAQSALHCKNKLSRFH